MMSRALPFHCRAREVRLPLTVPSAEGVETCSRGWLGLAEEKMRRVGGVGSAGLRALPPQLVKA